MAMSADPARRALIALLALAAIAVASTAGAQAFPSSGAFSLFADWSNRTLKETDQESDFSEIIALFSWYSDGGSDSMFEFGIDTRIATFPSSENRDERVSLYDAWVGLRGRNDRWNLKLGQMWVRDLGGIGAVAGVFGEYRLPGQSSFGRWRFGLFGGLEPEIMDADWVDGVRKGGIYAAVEGDRGRRHILGWVLIKNEDLTERSVVVFNNFIPVRRTFHFFQALEYDTQGPGGEGDSDLTYFFTNMRYTPVRIVDIQLIYHRGRSINARTITQDILDGRPIDPERLDGLLYESGRLRVSVRPWRAMRLWAGYGRERSNDGDDWNPRTELGVSFTNIGDIGFDITASNNRTDRGDDSYDMVYASLGKTFGRKVYLSLDYFSSVSTFTYDSETGGTVTVSPESDRYSLSGNISLNRTFSLLLIGEWMDHDDFEESRALAGLTIRF
jgi:hypothetical protein